jgi:preprotein translocase subunit SecA
LENLEALREAVYLRAYSQKNPLLEYKLEGFQIFDELIHDIRTSIASKIVKVKIQERQAPAALRRQPQNLGEARHRQLGQFAAGASQPQGSGAQSSAGAAVATAPPKSQPEGAQVKRNYPKVGRNDPCPCGSGKKYKYCHGR